MISSPSRCRRLASLISGVCMVLAMAGPGRAGTIQLEVLPGSHVRAGQIAVQASIRNLGDEAAHEIELDVWLDGQRARSTLLPQLPPGSNATFATTFPLPATPPGRMTAVLTVNYLDANGFPFSAIHQTAVLTTAPDETPPAIGVTAVNVELSRSDELAVRLTPPAGISATFEASLHLPSGLGCSQSVQTGCFRGSEPVDLRFPVARTWARPGQSATVMVAVRRLGGDACSGAVARAVVRVPPLPAWPGVTFRVPALVLAGLLLAGFVGLQWFKRRPVSRLDIAFGCACTLALAATLGALPLPLLFLDTMTVGGDTPAHNYLASHLAQTLAQRGRISDWAPGWWCGFPAFQFYFPLPYLLIALLDLALPFNVAFKLVAAAGSALLPLAAAFAARRARWPRPAPALAALAMIPFLFDDAHVMWGANYFSTLAGMIANSYSFPLLLLFLGCLARDTADARPRAGTAALLLCVLASHFFTSIMAGICTALLVGIGLIRAGARPDATAARRALLRTAAQPWLLASLAHAWWLVPLLARQELAVDFGGNWDVHLWTVLPRTVKWALIPAAFGAWQGFRRRDPYTVLLTGMAVAGIVLFLFGGRISAVFVNVRLYPFVTAPVLLLAAAGLARLIADRSFQTLAVAGLYLVLAATAMSSAPAVMNWAEWNLSGLEGKPGTLVFQHLVDRLDGTPGRLANDLHPFNNALGSSRIFESVPHRIRKPILEGGLVNSAEGALFAYHIQGETSDLSAGLPSIVTPASFDITNGTRHLAFFNVKHFIARSPRTRAALHAMPAWQPLAATNGWELFELTTHEGRYVMAPDCPPLAVRLDRQKKAAQYAGLDWLYAKDTRQTYALLGPDEPLPTGVETALDRATYHARLAAVTPTDAAARGDVVISETITDTRIRFHTSRPGWPHLIKCSWHPNWHVRGADHVYRVTPNFMLVYPTGPDVELRYGPGPCEWAGLIASLFTALAVAVAIVRSSKPFPMRS